MKTTTIYKYAISFAGGAILVLSGSVIAQVIPNVPALFTDVQNGTYFDNSVTKLVRMGVVKGYEDGRFGPNDSVTRAQVSVMIDRYDQEVIQPLREQLLKIREESGLGVCGDGIVQVGESCDDGNASDGDGCSANCLKENTAQPSPIPSQIQTTTPFPFEKPDSCAKENETVYFDFVAGPGRPAKCCDSSAGILLPSTLLDDGSCTSIPVGGARGTCSLLCGNGACDTEENICTCPKDCGK